MTFQRTTPRLNEEEAHRVGGTLVRCEFNMRVISRINKEPKKSQNKQRNNPFRGKMDLGPVQRILKRRKTWLKIISKIFLFFLSIMEIQVKTTLRFYLSPVKMIKINKTTYNRCWSGCGKKGTLIHCGQSCKLCLATLEISVEKSQKSKNKSTIRPRSTTLQHMPQRTEHLTPQIPAQPHSLLLCHQQLEHGNILDVN